MLQNDEVLYLVRQCRRAGTVQILSGHNSKSFIETMNLVREKPKADVNLCHIAPVKGKDSIGLFHAKNLFWGGSYQNKKLGNKQLGRGLSIEIRSLKRRWNVSEELSTNDILLKIEDYLGDTISDYIRECPIRKSKKAQVARKIISAEPEESFENLMRLSYKRLLEKFKPLSKESSHRSNIAKHESKYIVYIDEITRFISYNNDNTDLRRLRKTLLMGYIALERIERSKTYNKDFRPKYGAIARKYKHANLKNDDNWSTLKDLIYETSFRTLQGETVDIKKSCRIIKSYISLTKRSPFS
ncbi:hypothetical protein [Pseudomonas aeruginosa]|uniref:hypothetical protein n=1 Tax=Pseudomonas aeruginosa TaxID=287 RepID=UPI0040542BE4